MHKNQSLIAFLLVFLGVAGALRATGPGDDIFPTEEDSDAFVASMSNILNDFPTFGDDEYKRRLAAISDQIEYRLDPMVKERILVRTELYRESTERILGLSDVYFPIFEEHLAKHGLPHHLKYLPIIESNLNPIARSHAAAVGLWQFIPSTGKLYKLKINSSIDERSDTYKASEAAAEMLKNLFDYYDDWALALAAYNCGAGRINAAIKRAGSKNYWEARRFLPLETQKYVPYFMAMVYVGEYYQEHELNPVPQHEDLRLTDTIMLYKSKSMYRLAKEIGLSLDTLKYLNPAYRKSYIPADPSGRAIVLPVRIVAELRGYEEPLRRIQALQPENDIRALRRVADEEQLRQLIKAYRCSRKDVLIWNALPDGYQVQAGDLIAFRRYRSLDDARPLRALAKPRAKPISVMALRVVSLDAGTGSQTYSSAAPRSVASSEEVPKNNLMDTEAKAAAPVVVKASKAAAPSAPAKEQAAAPVLRKEAPQVAKPAVTTPRPSFERRVKPMQTNLDEHILNDRSRERRFRSAHASSEETAPSKSRERQRNLRHTEETSKEASIFQVQIEDNPNEPYLYYKVQGSESLADIKKLFPQASLYSIIQDNALGEDLALRSGQVLKIQR